MSLTLFNYENIFAIIAQRQMNSVTKKEVYLTSKTWSLHYVRIFLSMKTWLRYCTTANENVNNKEIYLPTTRGMLSYVSFCSFIFFQQTDKYNMLTSLPFSNYHILNRDRRRAKNERNWKCGCSCFLLVRICKYL